ncbi:MAG: translation initiation factor IF-2 N-terminal domain-containing protein, partial [Gammaproteobacteria bacterium]|nr:translation initiation factor IF-2 N-terminal domain-containing protein [Gammaproteobacteria bacterium]
MAKVSIIQFAEKVRTKPERLLEQLQEAGVSVSNIDDSITAEQQAQLLAHLKSKRGTQAAIKRAPITLKRRQKGTIKSGKNKVDVVFNRSVKQRVVVETTASPVKVKPAAAPKQAEASVAETETVVADPVSKTAVDVATKVEPKTAEPEKTSESAKPKPKSKAAAETETKKGPRRDSRSHRRKRHEDREELHMKGPKKKKKKKRLQQPEQAKESISHGFAMPTERTVHEVSIPESITVADLA